MPDPTVKTIQISADSNKTLTTNFIKQWTLTVSSADPSKGSVSGDSGLLDEGPASITAVPEDGYRFDRWEGDGVISSTEPITDGYP